MVERFLWAGDCSGMGDGWKLAKQGEFFFQKEYYLFPFSQHPPLCLIRTFVSETLDFL